MKAEEHSRRREQISGWEAEITSYRIGETYYCHIDNVSPGATVSRAEGKTREEAEREALAKATDRFAATKKRGQSPLSCQET